MWQSIGQSIQCWHLNWIALPWPFSKADSASSSSLFVIGTWALIDPYIFLHVFFINVSTNFRSFVSTLFCYILYRSALHRRAEGQVHARKNLGGRDTFASERACKKTCWVLHVKKWNWIDYWLGFSVLLYINIHSSLQLFYARVANAPLVGVKPTILTQLCSSRIFRASSAEGFCNPDPQIVEKSWRMISLYKSEVRFVHEKHRKKDKICAR